MRVMQRVAGGLRGGLIGLSAGAAFGVALGVAIAPRRDPASPVRHEWYTMAVFSYAVWSAAGGAVVGDAEVVPGLQP